MIGNYEYIRGIMGNMIQVEVIKIIKETKDDVICLVKTLDNDTKIVCRKSQFLGC